MVELEVPSVLYVLMEGKKESLERSSLERKIRIPGTQVPRAWVCQRSLPGTQFPQARGKYDSRVRKSLEHGLLKKFPWNTIPSSIKRDPGHASPSSTGPSIKFPWNAAPSSVKYESRVRKSLEHGSAKEVSLERISLEHEKGAPGTRPSNTGLSKKFPWNAAP